MFAHGFVMSSSLASEPFMSTAKKSGMLSPNFAAENATTRNGSRVERVDLDDVLDATGDVSDAPEPEPPKAETLDEELNAAEANGTLFDKGK